MAESVVGMGFHAAPVRILVSTTRRARRAMRRRIASSLPRDYTSRQRQAQQASGGQKVRENYLAITPTSGFSV